MFASGKNAVSWMGRLDHLAPISDFPEPPYGDEDNKTPFPVRPKEKRSYAQSCVVWIKAIGLQVSDRYMSHSVSGYLLSNKCNAQLICIFCFSKHKLYMMLHQ